jgi:hypothetical protein
MALVTVKTSELIGMSLDTALLHTCLPVETGSGGRTKYNRSQLQLPKTHALDAACVGNVADVRNTATPVLAIKATGRGSYQRTRVDKFGFPRGYLMKQKSVKGFQTGDLVSAHVPSGKKAGSYLGRVAVRASGSFNIQVAGQTVQGISHRHCRLIQRSDGYGYTWIASQKGNAGTGLAPQAALSLLALNGEGSCANG